MCQGEDGACAGGSCAGLVANHGRETARGPHGAQASSPGDPQRLEVPGLAVAVSPLLCFETSEG